MPTPSSSLATILNEDEIKVFGFVQNTTTTTTTTSTVTTTYVVPAQLSPTLNYLMDWGSTSDFGKNLTAAVDTKDNAWLYYVKINSDETKNTLQNLKVAGKTSCDTSKAKVPDSSTHLTAYCDSSNHINVIFQDSSKAIWEYDCHTKKSADISSTAGKLGTPLAVCATAEKVFLYYLDSDNLLIRSVKEVGKDWPGSHETVGGDNDSYTATDSSKLAVAIDKDGSGNLVFFIDKNGDDTSSYTCIGDDWTYNTDS